MSEAERKEVIEALRRHCHRLSLEKKIRRGNTTHRLLTRLVEEEKKNKNKE